MPKRFQAISGTETEEINKIKQRDSRFKIPKSKTTRDPNAHHRKTCRFCCGEHVLKKEKCPAWGTKCLNCGGRNHFAKACRKSKKSQRFDAGVKQIETSVKESSNSGSDSNSDSSEVDFITSITTTQVTSVSAVNSDSPKEIYTVMEIGNHAVKFQIDCGAAINITEALIGNSVITPTSKRLVMWNKTEITPIGATRVVLQNPKNRKKYSVEFVVVKENLTQLIGAQAAQHMTLITVNQENFVTTSPPHSNQAEVKVLNEAEVVIKRFSEVFDRPVGTFPGKVHLEVKSDAVPFIIPARRIPTALKGKFKEELTKLVEKKITTPAYK